MRNENTLCGYAVKTLAGSLAGKHAIPPGTSAQPVSNRDLSLCSKRGKAL